MNQLMTIEQVAEVLQLGPTAIRRAVGRGELAASKLGGRLRFKPEDVDRFVARSRVRPAETAIPLGESPVPRPALAQARKSFYERARMELREQERS